MKATVCSKFGVKGEVKLTVDIACAENIGLELSVVASQLNMGRLIGIDDTVVARELYE